MKLKKLFAMLMALAMVAGLLAACSNDTGNASTPPASEPVSDSQPYLSRLYHSFWALYIFNSIIFINRIFDTI